MRDNSPAQMEGAGQPRPGRLVEAVHRLVLLLQLQAQACRSSAVACSVAQRDDGGLERRGAPRRSAACPRRGHGDDGATVGPQLHDVVVRQPLQHLAHYRTADAEQLAQRGLGQLGAGRQSLAHHAVEDAAIDGASTSCPARRASSRGGDVAHRLGRLAHGRCGAGGISAPGRCRARPEQANTPTGRRASGVAAGRTATLTCGSPASPAMQVIAIVRRRTASTLAGRHRAAARALAADGSTATPSSPSSARTLRADRAAARSRSAAAAADRPARRCQRAAIAGAEHGCAR